MLKIAPHVSLPEDLAGRRTAIFGISGSGKSNTATAIVEELAAAGEQFVLIDPKGEAWGLLSLQSGRPSNLDVIIFGEPGGHIKTLTEHHGPQIADFVVESGRSIALSLTGFESDQSERRFVASFLRQLYRKKTARTNRTRTLVIFEEAHLFIPELAGTGGKGDVSELSGACQRIVRQGRSFGLGSLIVDQRPQDVAKRVLTQCDTIICHQLVHNKDRAALAAWIDANADDKKGQEFLSSLSGLQAGEAWIWSPKLDIFKRTIVRRRSTYDSGAAPDGSESVKVSRKEIDIAALGKQLNELVEKSKADDPKELRKQIADLEKKLYKSGKSVQSDPAAIEQARQAGIIERDRQLQPVVKEQEKRHKLLVAKLNKVVAGLQQLQQIAAVNGEAAVVAIPTISAQAKTVDLPKVSRDIPKQRADYARDYAGTQSTAVLSTLETALLTVLAQHQDGLTKTAAAVFAGYRPSGDVSSAWARFAADGWTERTATGVRISEAGISALGHFEPLPTGEELRQMWLSKLDVHESSLLKVLFDLYPEGAPKGSVIEAAGYRPSGDISSAWAKFNTLGFTQRTASGVRAADMWFE